MKRGMLFEAALVLLAILLSFLLLLMVTSDNPLYEWTMPDVITPPPTTESPSLPDRSNMFAGSDNTLYTIDGHAIHAINASGDVMWSVTIPDVYAIREHGSPGERAGNGSKWDGISMGEINGSLIFMVAPEESGDPGTSYLRGAILDISRDGRPLWTMPFTNLGDSPYNASSGYIFGDPRELVVKNGQLYVYSESYETIVSPNGSVLWYVDASCRNDFFAKPAVDDGGDLYAMVVGYSVVGHYPGNERSNATIDNDIHNNYSHTIGLGNGTILGGNYDTVRAYYANGTPKWRINISSLGIDDPLKVPYGLPFDGQPVYHDGTIYVWLPHTILALDLDGRLKWHQQYDGYYLEKAWFDGSGNLYIQYIRDLSSHDLTVGTHIQVIRPDGSESGLSYEAVSGMTGIPVPSPLYGNIAYTGTWATPLKGKIDLNITNATPSSYIDVLLAYPWDLQHDAILRYLRDHDGKWDFPRSLQDLDTYNIIAYDIKTGNTLWTYAIPLDTREAVITKANAASLLLNPGQAAADNNITADKWYAANGIPYGAEGIGSMSRMSILPGANATYVSFWSYCYEVPAIYNRSQIVYSGGIYAIGRNGTLLWKKETDSPVVSMQEVNGTVYYSTGSGKLSAVRAEVFAGFLAAFIYLFVRFFLAGAVTRARGLVDKNDNRKCILKFIADNPGSGLYEISRQMKMNKGTARYHLLILSMNHRIVPYRADDRYIRYFTNSGTYSKEEQLALSLARREGVRNVMAILLKNRAASVTDLSRELNIESSAASRYMKELVEKGVLEKGQTGDGRIFYSIKREYMGPVGSAVERLKSP